MSETPDVPDLKSLPQAPLIKQCFSLLDSLLRDTIGSSSQASEVANVGSGPATSEGPSFRPGPAVMEEGKYSTPSLSRLKGKKPSYYATYDEAYPSAHIKLERSASRLESDSKSSVSFRDISNNESIARQL